MNNKLYLPVDVGSVSDGEHTFDELYQHRHLLFMEVLHKHKEDAFKTKKDKDGNAIKGWFIAGLETEHGQITYHLPMSLWTSLNVSIIEKNENFDGHTSEDVLFRLRKLISKSYKGNI